MEHSVVGRAARRMQCQVLWRPGEDAQLSRDGLRSLDPAKNQSSCPQSVPRTNSEMHCEAGRKVQVWVPRKNFPYHW